MLPRAIPITVAMTTHAASVYVDVPITAPCPQGEFGRMSKVAPAARMASLCAKSSALGPFVEQQDLTFTTYACDAGCTYPIPVRPNQQTYLVLGDDETLVSFTLDDRNKKF